MNGPALLDVVRFELPRELLEDCYGALRLRGQEGLELFIALSARLEPGTRTATFTRALIPDQTCHRTEEGLLVTIEGQAIFSLSQDAYAAGEILAGQIHAHPGRAYHSGADDQLAMVRLPGALSIVVPDFAAAPPSPRRWSVHQRRADGHWGRRPRGIKLELT